LNLIAGAVFQFLKSADKSYLEIIEDRIVHGGTHW